MGQAQRSLEQNPSVAAESRRGSSPGPRPRRHGGSTLELRVLLIEDNPGDAALVEDWLHELPGIDVRLRCTPELGGALALLGTERFDAVLVDLGLPDAAPTEILDRLLGLRSSAAVIVVTGTGDERLRQHALTRGALDYLAKSDSGARLLGPRVLAAVERRRRESIQRQLEAWISTAPDATVVTSEAGRVLFVNRAALELFGRSEEDFLADNLSFSLEEGATTELDILRAGQHRVGEMRVARTEWNGTPALVATIRDNTERRAAELQLAAADRLATIGTMAASVAHEINNPTAAILVNLELAARSIAGRGDLGELAQLLEDACEAADRVQMIAQDMRLLSRGADEQLEAVELQRVVDTTLRLANHQTQHRTRVVVSMERGLPLVRAHQGRLGQVLLNLIVNAAQAVPEGHEFDSRITIACKRRDQAFVELSVSDTGAGMSEEVLRRLFTPFFTTKPAAHGTGLGLAICQRIIATCGGTIEVESEVGFGSTFRVVLPVATAEPEETLGPASEPPPSSGGARLLVVGHDTRITQNLARSLRANHDISIAYSCRAALGLLRGGERFDLILCEAALPDMPGTALYDTLEHELPEAARRITFLVNAGASARVQRALERIPNPKLVQPVAPEAVVELVERALRGGRS